MNYLENKTPKYQPIYLLRTGNSGHGPSILKKFRSRDSGIFNNVILKSYRHNWLLVSWQKSYKSLASGSFRVGHCFTHIFNVCFHSLISKKKTYGLSTVLMPDKLKSAKCSFDLTPHVLPNESKPLIARTGLPQTKANAAIAIWTKTKKKTRTKSYYKEVRNK